jgi:glycosyltransferase involved in cell wall biosynthesis
VTPGTEAPAPELSVVVPLHNEQENLPQLYARLTEVLTGLELDYALRFVDDGSTDDTTAILEGLAQGDLRVQPIYLARNYGHQAAVCAGLDHARGAATVVMDGDLQDPPEVIPALLERWREGFEVVYAVRRKRKEDPIRRVGYFVFYRLLGIVADLDIPLDSGDFCLMDRQVVEAMRSLPERQRFVRGLRTWVGFRQTGLEYERAARAAGEAKYTLTRLMGLAADGLISFSGKPLRLASSVGVLANLVALLLAIWVLVDAIAAGSAPQGWASTVVIVLFMGGVQLITLGVLGEYIRIIFLESKGRPAYVVRKPRSQA